MKVVVLFPAFNEQIEIQKVLENTSSFLKSKGHEIELIVVDDGSADQTASIIRSLQKNIPITLLQHEENKGLGVALRTGLMYILKNKREYDLVITSESDGTQKVEVMEEMIQKIRSGNDWVVASPLAEKEGFVDVPLYRKILSRGANWMYSILFPIPGLEDYTNLYRACRVSLLKKGLDYYGEKEFMDCSGFDAVPDLILKLRRFSPKIAEVPIQINFSRKSQSSMNILATILKSLKLCVHHLIH